MTETITCGISTNAALANMECLIRAQTSSHVFCYRVFAVLRICYLPALFFASDASYPTAYSAEGEQSVECVDLYPPGSMELIGTRGDREADDVGFTPTKVVPFELRWPSSSCISDNSMIPKAH